MSEFKLYVEPRLNLSEMQETVLFTLLGIEMMLLYAKTLKKFEKQILLRKRLKYLELLGELYLTEDERDEAEKTQTRC